jgi:hypothetical protein
MPIIQNRAPLNRNGPSIANTTPLISILYGVSIWSIALYVILGGPVLPRIGWLYAGGGSELEKIHPATYLLIAVFPLLFFFDRRFRSSAIRLVLAPSFSTFIVSCACTAAYAILAKRVSAAPFVDTFLSAVLVATLTLSMPRAILLRLRALLDIAVLASIALIFFEFATQQSVLSINPDSDRFGPMRWSGLWGLPLSAAQILAAYSLTTFVTSSIRPAWGDARRLLYSILALAACLLTGGRTAVALLIIFLALYVSYSAARQIALGAVNRQGIIYFIAGGIVATLGLPILINIGIFDVLTARVQFDYGSGLARDAVVEILGNLPMQDLWLGINADDMMAIQTTYGLIAFEIAWANFILICGLIFTIPLFVGFCLFFFRFLPKYCAPTVIIIGVFTLVLTFSYNSIWSKTTVLAITVAIAVSNMRRDVLDAQSSRDPSAPRRRSHRRPLNTHAQNPPQVGST